MSNFVQKPNTGRVWPNSRREQNDKAPHYTGKMTVDRPGTFEVSMWVNYNDDGKVKDVSLKFNEPYVKPDAAPAPRKAPALSDEIPF